MSQSNRTVHAALVIASAALALSIHTAVRRPSDGKPAAASACVDQAARDQLDSLRRALAERDAVITRLARAAQAPGNTSTGESPSSPSTLADTGPRRYAHFEIPNPAVSTVQKDDGTFDIRTTDPALAGSVMQITAVT